MRSSGEHGIFVNGGRGGNATLSNIDIKGNESELNEDDGIRVSLGSGGENTVSVAGITDNQTNSNRGDGISIGGNTDGTGATPISGNQAIANRDDGIRLAGSSTGYVVVANESKGNIGAGIRAVGNVNGGGNLAVGNGSCNGPPTDVFCF